MNMTSPPSALPDARSGDIRHEQRVRHVHGDDPNMPLLYCVSERFPL